MIKLKSALSLGSAALATMTAASQKSDTFKQSTPNIVLILMDDMGYGDIGRTGANQYDTQNLNRLVSQNDLTNSPGENRQKPGSVN